MPKLVPAMTLLLTLILSGWMANAQAGQIRYDVTIDSPYFLGGSGYMVFNDAGPVPGNIFPNIVDWYFTVGGYVFNTSNTQAAPLGPFVVDANYNFVNDFYNGIEAGPCFSASGCQNFSDVPLLAFTYSLGMARIVYPTGNGVHDDLDWANVQYSDPIFLNEAPLPSSLSLFALALAGLAVRRGRRVLPH